MANNRCGSRATKGARRERRRLAPDACGKSSEQRSAGAEAGERQDAGADTRPVCGVAAAE